MFERLRRAVEPGLRLDREIGSGGMGVVFLARDPVLERPVAIKVLRPELSTATGSARFLREARLLGRLTHPNIVAVHEAREVDGLLYYVMDFIDGETLAERLLSRPLSAVEFHVLANDLLTALEAVHAAGVVHRDIKPANIFLLPGRAMVTDFGIATDPASSLTTLTVKGAPIGTPAYMAPEQAQGGEATPQSDIYSAGATLYEAATGIRLTPGQWKTGLLPRRLGAALRRAVAANPADRWSNAGAFHQALRAPRRPWAWLVSGVVGLVAIGVWWADHRQRVPSPPIHRSELHLGRMMSIGPGAGPLADSVSTMLSRGLGGFADFTVTTGPATRPNDIRVEPRLILTATELRLEADIQTGPAGARDRVFTHGDPRDWAVLADSLLDLVSLNVLTGSFRADPWYPTRALPTTSVGLRALAEAERLYSQAMWDEAAAAYLQAARVDTACVLCLYRLNDVDRWLTRSADTARLAKVVARLDRFPPHYQLLIRAGSLAEVERIDTLTRAVGADRDFYLTWYLLGEELMHRGPLIGRDRREAIEPFQMATQLRPDFAPAWNHLGWLFVAEGDSANAAAALDRVDAIGVPPGSYEFAIYALVRAAFSWRFGSTGPAVTQGFLADPRLSRLAVLPAAPRMLPSFELPEAAVEVGRAFREHSDVPAMVRGGWIAEAFGEMAQGKIAAASAAATALAGAFPEERSLLLAASVPVVTALVDRQPLNAGAITRLRGPLDQLLISSTSSPATTRGAAVLIGTLEAVTGQPASQPVVAALAGPVAVPFRSFLAAVREAQRGNLTRALQLSEGVDTSKARLEDQIFFRGLVRLTRADWLATTGQSAAAMATLRWFEHQDYSGVPIGSPSAAEADWALAAWGRWRQVLLLRSPGGDRDRACRVSAEVVRAWAAGDPLPRARADSARQFRAECPTR